MYHRRFKTRSSQRGSMLLVAIFVLTVMIFLAVSMQDVFSNASRSVAYEVYGTRALSAANAGAESALQKIFYPVSEADKLSFNADQASLTLNLSAIDGFNGCNVAVTVGRFTITDSDYFYDYTHYRVESTATCVAGDFKTVRTVSVEGRER